MMSITCEYKWRECEKNGMMIQIHYNKMRVNKVSIRKQICTQYDKVILKLESPFEDFLQHIDITQYSEWTSQQLHKKYQIHHLQKNVVKFNYQYLLIETDHKDLLDVIEHILEQFIVHSIQYPTKYKAMMEVFKSDISKFDDCFLGSLKLGTLYETFTFYYHQDSNHFQEIQYRINRLSEFQEDILLYMIQPNEIKEKLALRNITDQDIEMFFRQLLKIYAPVIPKFVNEGMSRIGLEGSVIIEKIDYFIDLQKLAENKVEMKGATGQHYGLIFFTHGYQQSYAKLHKIIQNWLQKLNVAVVEIDCLQCCKKGELSNHFRNAYPNSHAIVLSQTSKTSKNSKNYDSSSQGRYLTEQILIFDPPKGSHSTSDLHHFFKSTNRIITGLHFPNLQFKLLHQFWNQFINFSNLNLKTSIYEDYLIVNCTRGQENKLRDKIKHFLQDRIRQEVQIQRFKTSFQIQIFQAIYLRQISIKNAEFFVKNGSLFRLNFVKDSEDLDKQLRELYNQMRKSIVSIPISKPLIIKKNYFSQKRALQWQDVQCLQGQQFKIQKKVTINIRSFASISSNQQDCIFIVQDVKLCSELLAILKQEETMNIEQKLNNNPVLGISLRYCRNFNNITTFTINICNNRETRWIRRIRQKFEQLINNYQSSRHIKFMFHQESHEAIKLLVPIAIDCVRTNCNLRAECKLKQVTFFTSVSGGKELRSQIVNKLKEVREKNVAIAKVCDLNLKFTEIEKIITYGYYTLKYFQQDETHQASPLNSFIFYTELKKKKKTPIFLPSVREAKLNKKTEYLVCCFNEAVYKITGRKIQKSVLSNKRLVSLKSIMKKYFPTIEFFVVFGDINQTYFCERLFYTSTQQKHYKSLQRVCLDMQQEKIIIQKSFVKYELIQNQFLQLKKIETHPSKVLQLLKYLDQSSLY